MTTIRKAVRDLANEFLGQMGTILMEPSKENGKDIILVLTTMPERCLSLLPYKRMGYRVKIEFSMPVELYEKAKR